MYLYSIDQDPASLVRLEHQIELAIAQLSCVLESRLTAYEQPRYHQGMQVLHQSLQELTQARQAKRFTARRHDKAS